MELTCYLHPGWAPLIRPAPSTRAWMDATPESFAYRCLPLNIANAHGWELLSPIGFDAVWNGESGTDAVSIRTSPGTLPDRAPVSLFGQGVLTFHIEGIFRTPPGWNLWIGGSPNRAKDGIVALNAIVETDWSPFTFTMNWRFTRPGHTIHFDAMEPMCFIFPVQRDAIEAFAPAFEPLDADPATMARFQAWSASRDAFHQQLAANPPSVPADRWQKHYYRGVDAAGQSLAADHRTKLHLKAFDRSAAPGIPAAPETDAPAPPPLPLPPLHDASADVAALRMTIAKREWLLEAVERQRALAPRLVALDWHDGLGGEDFLEHYYAQNRPVVLTGEMASWPALSRWTPDYLKSTVGSRPVEFQGGRRRNPAFEMDKEAHRQTAPFDMFIDHILRPDTGNDAYLTAYNSAQNTLSLSVLQADLGFLDKFLERPAAGAGGMMWIGPSGTCTSLHHDLTNNFIAQLVGRKRIRLAPAADVGKLYNHRHVFSEIPDLDAPGIDGARYPRLAGLRLYDVLLNPGDILFVPLGWWHQVKSLDFSVTVTYTNFLWPNDAFANYPS